MERHRQRHLVLTPREWAASGYPEHFTDREYDVLKLFAEGLQYKEIAARLNISVQTVKNHASKIFLKSGCHTMMEVIHFMGWINIPEN